MLSHVDEALVAAYRDRLLAEGVFSPASINRKLSSLRKYIGWAASQNLTAAKEGLQNNLNNVQNIISAKPIELPKEAEFEAKQPEILTQKQKKNSYSAFPPLRVVQKLGKAGLILFDTVITSPLAHATRISHKAVWSLRGKPMFTKSNVLPKTPSISHVKNIAKSLYAPLSVSLANLPLHEKLIFHARNTRPNWYKRYHSLAVSNYFHWAILMIFMTAIGFGFYNNFVEKPKTNAPALAATAPPRILSFQGRLTDANNNPITSATNLRFAIYNDLTATGSALQWQEVDSVTPDANGVFSVLLGNGTTIPQSLFANNSSLFLGISVGSTAELTPRQQLATVAYATNAETLQGLPPITNSGNTTNVVLALDGSGNLTIGGTATPIFTASGGQFTLAGKTLNLTTVAGSNTNVQLAPDGKGLVDVQKPLTNTTHNNNIASAVTAVEVDGLFAVLATSSGQSAITVNQNGAGPIFSASSSGTSRFTIANNGALSDSNYTAAGGVLYTDASGNFLQTGTSTNTQCLIGGTAPTWTACSNIGQNYWQISNGALVPVNATVDLFVGGTATSTAKFSVLNMNSGTPTASVSSGLNGTASYFDANGNFQTANNMGLTIGGTTTGNIALSPLNGTGRVTVNGSLTTTGSITSGGVFTFTGGNQIQTTGTSALTVGGNTTGNILLQPNNGTGQAGVGSALIADDGAGAGGANGQAMFSVSNTSTTTVFPKIILNGPGANNAGEGLEFYSGGATQGDLSYLNSNKEFDLINRQAGGFVSFQTNSGTVAERMRITNMGFVGIGSATTGNAQLVVNQADLSGLGDIFTASAGGVTRFTVQNDGTLIAPKYNVQAGILYMSNTTGTVAETAQGSSGQCLVSNGTLAPSWSNCASAASNWWNMNNGALYPINSTFDLLLGGSATTSAKFAVINMASGTPTASVSSGLNGTAMYMDANGNLQTANNMGLTIGGTTTGNITVSPLNGGTGSTFTVNAATTALNSANVTTNQTSINVFNTTASTINFAGAANTLNVGNAGGTVTFASATINDNQPTVSLFGSPTTVNFGAGATTALNIGASNTPTFINGNVQLGTNNTNTITPNGLMNADLVPSGTGLINLGSSGHYYNTVYANNFVAPVSGGTSGFWSLANDVIFPVNTYFDLAIGGTSTASADFQVFSENVGTIVGGTATSSGMLSFRNAATKINLLNGATLDVQTSVGGDAGLASVLHIANNGNITATGNLALNGGSLTTTSTTGNLFNSTATTVNIGAGASIGVNIGNASGTSTYNGNLLLGSSSTNTITATGEFNSNLLPNATNTYDLGNILLGWRNLYITGNYGGFWQRFSGVVSPINITDDLAIGGTATSSAKFQIFGSTINGEPAGTASTSGQLTFNTSSQVNLLNNANLGFYNSVGGDSGITAATPELYLASNGHIGINTNNPSSPLSINVDSGFTPDILIGGGTNVSNYLGVSGSRAMFGYNNSFATMQGNSNHGLEFITSTGTTFGTGTVAMFISGNGVGAVGIGNTAPGNAALAVNQANLSGLGDIFTASAAGTPLFTIANDGTIKNSIIPNITDTYNLGSNPSLGGKEWDTLYVRQIISPVGGGTAGYWQLSTGGVLAPANLTNDLAVGGTSTASARFQVFATGTGAGTISATLNNPKVNNDAGSLLASTSIINIGSANHTYMTLNNQDLTVGGHKNLITLSNVQRVFMYDTSKDSDGGRWTSDDRAQAASWYNEARTAADSCVIGTNTRCGTQAFPRKAILVATSTNLYVFDAKDNSLWMQFTGGAHNMLTNSIGTTTGLTALNGEIYISYTGSGTSFGLTTINFISDKSYAYGTNTKYTSDNKGIVNRNVSGTGDAKEVELASNAGIVSASANDVAVAVINGKTYFAVATGGGANGSITLIDESDLSFVANFAGNVSSSKVALTPTGTLYALVGDSSTPANYALKVKYFVQNISLSRTNNNQTFDVVYATQSTTNYGVTTTDNNTFGSLVLYPGPAATTAAQMNATGLFVTQGTSTNDGTSNTIYIGEGGVDGAVAALQENEASPAAGSIKYYKKGFVTDDLVGDTRGYWPMNEASGNLSDASIKGNTLVASTSGITYGVSGVRGTAVTLDGTSGYFSCSNATCGGVNNLGISGNGKQIVLGAWVKTTSSAARQVIMSKFNNTISGSYLLTVETSGKVMWALNGLSPNLLSVHTVNDGNWHYVVATYDGANMDIYIDGQLDGQQGRTGTFSTDTTDFYLGAYLNANAVSGLFNGSIDQPFVSTTPMEASEIAHNYLVGYRALQLHAAQTIRGTTIAADASQEIANGNGNVTAVTAGTAKSHLYIGTNNGVSIFGLDSDSIADVYNNNITTTDDVGNTWANNNNYITSISMGQSFGNGNTLVFGSNNGGNGGAWLESQDTLLKDVLATSYNPFGSNLTQDNLNVDGVLRLTNQLSTKLDNLAYNATTSAVLADIFRVDSNGMNMNVQSTTNNYAASINQTLNTNPGGFASALNVVKTYTGTGTQSGFEAINAGATLNGSGTISTLFNLVSNPQITTASTGTITSATGLYVRMDNNSTAGGSVGTWYGIHIASASGNGIIGTQYAMVTDANAGNVGIGTNTPAYPLDVNGTIRGASFLDQQNTAYFLDPAATGTSLTIAGKEGIGTLNPAVSLDVNGSINASGSATIYGTALNQNNDALVIRNADLTTASNEYVFSHRSNNKDLWLYEYDGTTFWNPIKVDGVNKNITFVPDTVGNVGIGLTAPTNRLTVQRGAGNSATADIYTTDGSQWIQFNSNLAAGAYNNITAAGNEGIIFSNGTSGTGTFQISPWATGPSGLIMDSAGNVGIATAAMHEVFNVAGSAEVDGVTNPRFVIFSNSVGAHQWEWYGAANADAATLGLFDRTAGAYRMLINTNGEISVGLTSEQVGGLVLQQTTGSFANSERNGGNGFEIDQSGTSHFLTLYMGTDNGYGGSGDGNGASYIQSARAAVGVKKLVINGRSGQVIVGGNGACTTFTDTFGQLCADYAEYYDASEIVDPADIVSADAATISAKVVTKTKKAYDPSAIGIVSSTPAVVINDGQLFLSPDVSGGQNGATPTVNQIQPTKRPPVASAGRVPVKFATINGPVHVGDVVTSSGYEGFGMKPTQAGPIVGKVIQEFDPANGKNAQGIIPCPADMPSGVVCGKVFVLLNVSWYDPDVYLTTTGNLNIMTASPSADFTVPTYYTLNDLFGNPISRMGTFLELAVANLRAGSVQAQQMITGTLAITTDNVSIAGMSLRNYILSVVQSAGFTSGTLSPIASVDQLHTNLISPLASDSAIAVDLTSSKFTIRNSATGSAVASIDNVGNATFSGTLNSKNLAVNSDATVSGTLRAHRIVADEIEGLAAAVGTLSAQNITNVTNIYFATPSAAPTSGNIAMGQTTSSSSNSGLLTPSLGYTNVGSYSSFLAYVPNLSASTAIFDGGLTSLGTTALSDTTITGQLSIGATLTLANNSINVLGQSLEIQPLRQGGINFEGGLLAIDTDGNLTVNGNAVFGKTLAAHIISPLSNSDNLTLQLGQNPTASGAALATANLAVQNASGSGIFSIDQLGNVVASGAANIAKLNFNLVQPALAVSDTEVIASGSAGTAVIKAHQTEVTIDNTQVTAKSLIYITPVGQSLVTPYLIRQVNGTSFTVGVSLPQNVETNFNWLIVN